MDVPKERGMLTTKGWEHVHSILPFAHTEDSNMSPLAFEKPYPSPPSGVGRVDASPKLLPIPPRRSSANIGNRVVNPRCENFLTPVLHPEGHVLYLPWLGTTSLISIILKKRIKERSYGNACRTICSTWAA